jgi:endogenous inhibitor of DNA gyrase (YacG/DUF329 family)
MLRPTEKEKKCPNCGKPAKKTYCSLSCYHGSRSTSVNCTECHKTFKKHNNQIEARGKYGHFCSHSCYGSWRSKNIKEEKSPLWKGGLTTPGLHSWKRLRYKARVRDKYKCQDCGYQSSPDLRDIDAYPIVSYEALGDKYFTLDNLITICNSCKGKARSDNVLL